MTPRALLIAWYVCAIGVLGAIVPYLAVVLVDAGATPEQVASCVALFPLGSVLGGPAWASLADRTGSAREVLVASCAMAAVATAGMALAPDWRWLAAAIFVFGLARGPQIPMVDVLTVRVLGPARESYGRVRLWGSVSFLVIVLGAGPAFEQLPRLPMWAGVVLCAASAVVSGLLPQVQAPPTPRLWSALRRLAQHRLLMSLLAVSLLHGITSSVFNLLFSLHVEELGFSATATGAGFAIGVAVEVAVMAQAHRLMARGPALLYVVGLAAGVPRWVLTAMADTEWLLIAAQSLHGLTFGAWWIASVALFTERSPEGVKNAAQALMPAVSHGLGALVAMGIASPLLAVTGTTELFGGMAAFSVLATVGGAWVLWRDERG